MSIKIITIEVNSSINIFVKTWLILIFLLLSGKGLSQNQTDTSVVTLKEIVISDVYNANNSDPVTHQNIQISSIEKKLIGQEPSFVLSQTPSMTVYSDAGSYQGYSYLRLRGIDQTRINMTLDGVPLNEPEDQGVYFSNYPDFLNSISSVQIQRGAGTSKNGSASYAGSIEFESPRLFSDSTKSTIGTGYGSFNSYRVFGEHLGRKGNKSLYLRASLLHSDGFKYRSSNDSKSIFYGSGIYFGNQKLKLIGFAGNQRNQMAWIGVPEEEIANDPKTNSNTEENDNFSQIHHQLQHTFVPSNKLTIQTSIYYNYLKGNYDFDLNNFFGLPSTNEMYNYALSSHFAGGLSSLHYHSESIQVTGGIYLNSYQRTHTGSESSSGKLYENTGFRNEFSAFGKLHFRPSDQFLLFGDLQYRTTNFRYDGTVEMEPMSWQFINPLLGVTYSPTKSFQVYYSIGRTGREPTRTDLFGGWDDLQDDGSGNPQLVITDPEYVLDQEIGIRVDNDFGQLKLNFFNMDFENEIVLNGQFGPNGLALNSKVDKSYRRGMEINVEKHFNRLTSRSNFAFTKSQIKEQSEAFSPILTPKYIIGQELSYNYFPFEVSADFRYQSKSFIDFANASTIDSFFFVNTRVSYHWKTVTVTGFVNNITDQQYFTNGYIDPAGTRRLFIQAPRNYYISIAYQF